MKKVTLCFAVFVCLGVLSASAADLSDIETFLGEKSFDEVQVSPDGSRLAFLLRENDFGKDREVFTLWRIDLPGGHAGPPVRIAETGRSSNIHWSPDGKLLSYLEASAPGAGAQVVTIAPSPESKPRAVTSADRFRDGIDLYDWLPDGSGFVVSAADPAPESSPGTKNPDGDVVRLPAPPAGSSLSKIALADGRVERLFAAPFDELEALAVSPDGRSMAVLGSGASESIESSEVALLPLAGGDPASSIRRTHNLILEDRVFWVGANLFVSGMGEARDGRFVVTEPRLFRAEPNARAGELGLSRVAPAMEGSLGEVVPLADGTLLTSASVSTRMRVFLIDPATGKTRHLRDQRGWVSNLSASRDGKRIAFVAGDPGHFAELYVAEGPAGAATAKAVTEFNASLSKSPLPEIETVSWKSEDGATVEGVLDWPPGHKGERGLPLIVDLHGGPFGVARIEALDLYSSYTSYPSLLAARGFLVLNANYRGSGGRGDEFTRGIQDHFCSLPSEDVIRGVESLVARGWADPKRVGVIGYSGGGGLTKCLAGRTDIFQAIVTGAGVWDGISLCATGRGRFWADVFFGGKAPWEDFQHWWNETPIGSVQSAKTPTLIVAGERDGVSPAQAKEMYSNLLWRGVPAELLLFPGESHIFAKPSHKKTKIRSEVDWLEHYVLGKPARRGAIIRRFATEEGP